MSYTDNGTAIAPRRRVMAKRVGSHSPLDLDLPALADEPWMGEAICAQTDSEAFFPEKGGTTKPAKQICATCPVRSQCLEYAMDHDERFGVWGGLSERERRKLRWEREGGMRRNARRPNGHGWRCRCVDCDQYRAVAS